VSEAINFPVKLVSLSPDCTFWTVSRPTPVQGLRALHARLMVFCPAKRGTEILVDSGTPAAPSPLFAGMPRGDLLSFESASASAEKQFTTLGGKHHCRKSAGRLTIAAL